jgi:DNA-binding protein HU-beta
MNREQLVTQVSRDIGLPKTTVDKCLNGLVNTIKCTLISGDVAKIRDFGTFELVEHRERNGINPQTKESIVIPATTRIKFRASDSLLTENN